MTHPHLGASTLLLHLRALQLILDALGSLGVQENTKRVRSRGSAGSVGTLLRWYLDGCLLIIVSVRDFFCYSKIEFKCKFQFLPFTGLSVHLRVVNDPSLRLLIETDNLGQGWDQYGIVQTWCLDQTLPLNCFILHGLQRQPAGGDSPVGALVILHVRVSNRAQFSKRLVLVQGNPIARSKRRRQIFS